MNRHQRRANAKRGNRSVDPAAATMLAHGLRYHRAGKLAEAERCYRQVLAIQPDHADALQLVGAIAFQMGRYDVAVDWIGRAIKQNGNVAAWFSNLGVAFERQGKLEDALASHDKALALKPDYVEGLNNRATALKALGRIEEALASCDAALVLSPDFAEALNNRGNMLQALGRLDEALVSYDRSLKLKPDYAEAFNNRGDALRSVGRVEQALTSYDTAVTLNPSFATAFNGRGLVLRDMNRLEDALVSYNKAIALNPNFVEAHNNAGVVLAELGRFDEALSSCDRVLALNPNLVLALNNRGNLLQALGRADEALAEYEKALSLAPEDVAAVSGRGSTLHRLKRFHGAEKALRHAILLEPNNVEAYFNLANVLIDLGNLSEAESFIRRAVELKPDNAMALNNLGKILVDLGRLDEAEEVLRHAVALKSNLAAAHYNLGIAFMKLGKLDEAEEAARRAIALEPDHAGALHNLGVVLLQFGRLTEAREAAERAAMLAPAEPLYFRQLGEVRRFVADDPYIEALEALSKYETSLSVGQQIELHFAMAKARADVGDMENAFRQLLAGNKLKRSCVEYNEIVTFSEFDRAQQVFTPDFIRASEAAGEPSPRPIFILGMPRSGTTLLEQILASHPQVFGGGELNLLEHSIGKLRSQMGELPSYSEIALHMSGEEFRKLGAGYLARIRALSSATHVTDKMPGNFIFAGIIHLALPNAAIIHVVRDPVDTCVSCFSKLFTEGNFQTYDLAELGRYYRHYKALMAHWHRVLPPGRILDVNYEDMVADVEGVVRRILTHCNLPWDERCLEFYRTERVVRTASAIQVRQPIYASSIGRWRTYQHCLTPLLTELQLSHEDDAELPSGTPAWNATCLS